MTATVMSEPGSDDMIAGHPRGLYFLAFIFGAIPGTRCNSGDTILIRITWTSA